MADADTTSEVVQIAGFRDVTLHRHDIPITIGRDLDEAVAFVMALGPAGEVLRLAGPRAEHLLPDVIAALKDALAPFAGPDGVVSAPASTWTVAARAPA